MLPYLANLIHRVKVSLHDNTYARIHGPWKEWEVVIWDDRLNFRCSIGRIYSQHETFEVFKKMWPGLFETIARITDAEVKFKFIDGEGLTAILVDGSKPQANALGEYLVSRNGPHLSEIHEKNPKLILPNCLRTCVTHVNRKFTKMALVVPDEPMSRIRRCLFIKTQRELDDFIQWCKDSEYKVVRDWIADKESIPWFFPSINEFLSKIPEEDCAHPYTNQHTGTNLSLLEAIDRPLSVPQLETIEDCLQQSAATTKELREQRKALKLASGVKKTKRTGEKAREILPNADEFAGLSDAENIQSSPVRPALHLCDDTTQVRANLEVELEAGLEPLFPIRYSTPYLELGGDLLDYIPT
ncbi:hypothetical protein C8F04DRAFT_1183059 [Mycena alexandri]|uniref:Uncharacterized protein n=1 Tax=Mycena alexandri TaxID=1745969 RepID=A0AAD6SVC9_9AGAR|nr:hypothetical protein C8F04DRAFT_1183059 [Mycena alexandri]